MSRDPNCVWITSEVQPGRSRCTIESNTHEPGMTIFKGGPSGWSTLEDHDFRLPSDDTATAIQIRPQKIKLKLRQNESITFTLKYKALENYPLDIYYLVDQTFSMAKHLDELSKLNERLANTLEDLTTNFRIAFGYFSDKVLMPYYAMDQARQENPCRDLNTSKINECVLGSNFVHELNFTNNTASFQEKVKDFKFTANLDDPEGALDALMQIILCDSFGWRNYSRKMIVLATDGLLHTAGEGILGGVVNRAPRECKVKQQKDGRWVYDGLQRDYPSVEEIYRALLMKKIAIIFAIQETYEITDYYKEVNDLLHKVSFLAMMRPDRNNITEVLETGFRDVVKKVLFNVVDPPHYLKFDSVSTCGEANINHTWGCYKVELGKEYTFNITVTLKGQPRGHRHVIHIEEMHLHEQVEIEIEYPETCECDTKKRDPNIHGEFSCGIYKCDPGWIGDRCDQKCDPSTARYTESCKSKACCGYGEFNEDTCKCDCNKGRAGNHCEIECYVDNKDQVCSGHGHCGTDGCICEPGVKQDKFCNCTVSTDTCVKPGKTDMCSKHGVCNCGKCECNKSGTGNYRGKYCEFCSGCNICEHQGVLAKHIRGQLTPSERKSYVFWPVTDNEPQYDCRMSYSPNSTHECEVFYISTVDGTTSIMYYLKCSSNPSLLASLGFMYPYACALLAIFFIVLLSWKAHIFYADRRSFAKFEEAKKHTSFNENQLYKSPITSYRNPTKKEE